jgi:hypothetical protein
MRILILFILFFIGFQLEGQVTILSSKYREQYKTISGTPSLADLPVGTYHVFRNSATDSLHLWGNNNGVITKITGVESGGGGGSQTLDQTLDFGNTADTNIIFNGMHTLPIFSGNINSDQFMLAKFQAKGALGFGIGFKLSDINGDPAFPDRVWNIGTNLADGAGNRLDNARAGWTISMEDLYLGNSEFHIVSTRPSGFQTRILSANPSHTLPQQSNTYISANPFSLVTMTDPNTAYVIANYSYDSVAYNANPYGANFQVIDPSSSKNITLRVIKNSSDAGNKGEILIGGKNMLTHYDYSPTNKFLQFGENNALYTNWFPSGMISVGYNSEAIIWAGIGTLKIGDQSKLPTQLKIYSGENNGYGAGVSIIHKNQLTSKEIIQGDVVDTFFIKNYTDNVDILKVDITNSSVRIGNNVSYEASAILNAQSTTKGFLPPRMTKSERDAISSPATGLVIYQTDNTPGLRCYNGTNHISRSDKINKFMIKQLVICIFLLFTGLVNAQTNKVEKPTPPKDSIEKPKQINIQEVSDIELLSISTYLQEEYKQISQKLDMINKELQRRVEIFNNSKKK